MVTSKALGELGENISLQNVKINSLTHGLGNLDSSVKSSLGNLEKMAGILSRVPEIQEKPMTLRAGAIKELSGQIYDLNKNFLRIPWNDAMKSTFDFVIKLFPKGNPNAQGVRIMQEFLKPTIINIYQTVFPNIAAPLLVETVEKFFTLFPEKLAPGTKKVFEGGGNILGKK